MVLIQPSNVCDLIRGSVYGVEEDRNGTSRLCAALIFHRDSLYSVINSSPLFRLLPLHLPTQPGTPKLHKGDRQQSIPIRANVPRSRIRPGWRHPEHNQTNP